MSFINGFWHEDLDEWDQKLKEMSMSCKDLQHPSGDYKDWVSLEIAARKWFNNLEYAKLPTVEWSEITTAETNYSQFAALLRQLHVMISEGKGDSEEADDIRDEMDAPWELLTDEEHDKARELSIELYKEEERKKR